MSQAVLIRYSFENMQSFSQFDRVSVVHPEIGKWFSRLPGLDTNKYLTQLIDRARTLNIPLQI